MMISWYIDPCLTRTRIVGGGTRCCGSSGSRFWTSIPPGRTSNSFSLPFTVVNSVVLVLIRIILNSNFFGERILTQIRTLTLSRC
ncbi:hypothetical protein Hanom_Chr13g01189341 [Helianthus anomalus]